MEIVIKKYPVEGILAGMNGFFLTNLEWLL